jgi:hypothetical protein
MIKPLLKIKFDYFWEDFDPDNNYFTRVLEKKYTLEVSDEPDLLFFTNYYHGSQREYLKNKCHRVFLGWENTRADWNCCDYVLDSDFYVNNLRHKRWPIWAAWNTQALIVSKNPALFHNKKSLPAWW